MKPAIEPQQRSGEQEATACEIVPTVNGYVWIVGDEAHELYVAFGMVHVRRRPL